MLVRPASVLLLAAIMGAGVLATTAGCKRKAPATADGAQLFTSMCARCHGADGKGGLSSFGGTPPRNLTDHKFHADRTDEQIRMSIMNGKGAAMPPFGSILERPQVDALVAHVRSLDAAHP